jgi:catechol 2,3-dioxygenase
MNPAAALPAETALGAVALTVPDLDRSLAFYTRHLGLVVHRQAGREAALGGDGGASFLRLVENLSAEPAPHATGLYHFAILVPSRQELAAALVRLARTRTPLQGASDHGVSEALYLADPDDNGIEIYRDRPREEWPRQGGRLAMRTDPLDLDELFAVQPDSYREAPARALGAATRLGHIHLHVANLEAAVSFYRDVLGFELQQMYGNQAAFLSAGGYHHHVAVNTWRGQGAPPPAPEASGLREWEILLPDRAALTQVGERLAPAGIATSSQPDGLRAADPSGNALVLRAL